MFFYRKLTSHPTSKLASRPVSVLLPFTTQCICLSFISLPEELKQNSGVANVDFIFSVKWLSTTVPPCRIWALCHFNKDIPKWFCFQAFVSLHCRALSLWLFSPCEIMRERNSLCKNKKNVQKGEVQDCAGLCTTIQLSHRLNSQ